MNRLSDYIDRMPRSEVWCWCAVFLLAFWVALVAAAVWLT